MKRFYGLVTRDFGLISKLMLVINLILIIGQNILISGNVRNSQYHYIPFERIIDTSGAPYVFYFCMVLVIACCVYTVVANFVGSKSIYTLMTLPGMRRQIYFSKLTAGAAAFLMLICAQLISIFIGYVLFSTPIVSYGNDTVSSVRPVNGLFLAFIRSDFLRTLFPLSLESFVSITAMFISLLFGIYYVILCIQSRRYLNIGITLINAVTAIYILNYRANAIYGWKDRNLYIYSILFLVLAVFYAWQSINWIAKSRNLG